MELIPGKSEGDPGSRRLLAAQFKGHDEGETVV